MDSTSSTRTVKAIEVSNIGAAMSTKTPPAIFTWVIIVFIFVFPSPIKTPQTPIYYKEM
jgi:hypothetical protein